MARTLYYSITLFVAVCTVPTMLADESSSTKEIKDLITAYAISIDHADGKAADQLFSNAPGVTFIHPRGEEHGREQIEADVYSNLMGRTFSERKLTPGDIAVHVYGDTAWSEFHWDFAAKFRKDGSPFHSRGVETQIYRREDGEWRIVHVHYSGVAVTGKVQASEEN